MSKSPLFQYIMVKNIPSDHKRISREIGEQGVVPFGQPLATSRGGKLKVWVTVLNSPTDIERS